MTEPTDDMMARAALARERVRNEPADEALAAGRVVVDVRQPEEFAADHLDGAVNIPLGELADRAGELGDPGTGVVTYCNGGNRGALGADTLGRLGWTDVVNLDGGLRGVRAQEG
ncbi:rhodanese-like domain-containing protein [Nocardioides sp. CFH 31398]|uniref:rhodanese-like domain-containing protein n=1 Tax=Nocardioides sp. CFH 31398 TaxID=2919579 RepID=UPI001F0632D9|nr:rhodanese-like domain-containing protein [Nocardioides sp. CFH 31398]MCH1865031.1 rhodanese-like domain-containing protein [Nocardioides sp. CFH 31398]